MNVACWVMLENLLSLSVPAFFSSTRRQTHRGTSCRDWEHGSRESCPGPDPAVSAAHLPCCTLRSHSSFTRLELSICKMRLLKVLHQQDCCGNKCDMGECLAHSCTLQRTYFSQKGLGWREELGDWDWPAYTVILCLKQILSENLLRNSTQT